MVTESHMASRTRWKSSSVGGGDRVRKLPLRLLKQCDVLGGDSGQEEQKAQVSRSHALKFLILAGGPFRTDVEWPFRLDFHIRAVR